MTANEKITGTLFIVATPIGNLKDITYRAVELLREADYIAAEDTRKSRFLLGHYGITGKKLLSYFGPKETTKARDLLKPLMAGYSVALVPDSGTPGISDPAMKIVRLALLNSINVVPIPGPSALLAALCASGLDTASFVFEGFLSIKRGRRATRLKELFAANRTVVLFESTHRIHRLLDELESEIPERRIVIAREMTKMFEEFLRGTPSELKKLIVGKKAKGEFVVMIEKPEKKNRSHISKGRE
ncbi:MAG: ribosomal RNA small subunit methyltransferase I [bacterium]|nr:MAG: ribosomal RNA small subunit methyltransferase I [bacterium]